MVTLLLFRQMMDGHYLENRTSHEYERDTRMTICLLLSRRIQTITCTSLFNVQVERRLRRIILEDHDAWVLLSLQRRVSDVSISFHLVHLFRTRLFILILLRTILKPYAEGGCGVIIRGGYRYLDDVVWLLG